MSYVDYHKGQEHAHYGFGMSQGDFDYRRGYNDEMERQERESYEYYERQKFERDMEELMIEEEMQRQMIEEQQRQYAMQQMNQQPTEIDVKIDIKLM